MSLEHDFSVYAADGGMLVNGQPGDSSDFVRVENIHTITLTADAKSTLTVTDNNNDKYLHADDCHNEKSDDGFLQTVDGIKTYVDYEIVFAAPDGSTYTAYVIDVGESSSTSVPDNTATTFLTFDPDNMPPEGVELSCVSWKQTPHLKYDDFEVPCFAEGTCLSLNDGGIIAVEDIKIGDDLMTVSGRSGKVLWVGSSVTEESLYGIYHPNWGTPVLVTQNHGIAVDTTSGYRHLCAAKFLVDAKYGDFLVTKHTGQKHTVYHVMLETHEILVTSNGLHSESYFCGGWNTLPEAEDALLAATGKTEMELVHPRVKRRDADEIAAIRMWNFPHRTAA